MSPCYKLLEVQIEIGDTFRNPKFRDNNRLMTFDRVVANPMWNQTMFGEKDYDADALLKTIIVKLGV